MVTPLRNLFLIASVLLSLQAWSQRTTTNLNHGWKFYLGDDSAAREITYDDSKWRLLNLPHDWSIEGSFSKDYPTTFNQGALPAGIGWYRKTFTVPTTSKEKRIFIDFDGVYRNNEVWINGHYLRKRPNGYISFRYELTSYLKFGADKNVIAVKVDNSTQPSSRWYTGSGIYRNVRLVSTNKVALDDRTIFISTGMLSKNEANISIRSQLTNSTREKQDISVVYRVRYPNGKFSGTTSVRFQLADSSTVQNPKSTLTIPNPRLWSPDTPILYTAIILLKDSRRVLDSIEVRFGMRDFHFDSERGFFMNGQQLKILGVCMHHDLGALGAAVNKRAIQRQLEILKAMGCNAIRTAHNPPAPELLDLCDEMGFLVMDEAFDMWKKRKNKF